MNALDPAPDALALVVPPALVELLVEQVMARVTAEEAQAVSAAVRGWLAEDVSAAAIGVVGRTRPVAKPAQEALSASGVAWQDLDDDGGSVRVGTMHSAKGLEFARLAVVGVNADTVPLPLAVTPEAEDPAQHALDVQRERCLLYVACTRARDELLITGSGPASPLLPA
jgi:superfamily I DNA/RNA helicase